MKSFCLLILLAGFAAGSSSSSLRSRRLEDGEFCTSGFVMDKYCINRGTLLDNSRVATLEGPERHSIHCLVDVGQCINSGYEILGAPTGGSRLYTRTVELDDVGNEMVLTEARRVGRCSTCYGTGNQAVGFAATVIGTLDTSHTGTVPRLLVRDLVAGEVDCAELELPVAPVTAMPTPEPTTEPPTEPPATMSGVVDFDWFVPSDPFEPITVEAGTIINFNWGDEFHNVYLHPSGNCGESLAVEVGQTTGASYTTSASEIGQRLTFSCDVGFHCEAGMILFVDVVASPTPAPTPLTGRIDFEWFIPPEVDPFEDLTVEAGSTIRFNWDSFHNVYLHPSGTCDDQGALLVGDVSGASYTFSDGEVGETLTFACDVGDHCEFGMVVNVKVVASQPLFCFSSYSSVTTLEEGVINMDELKVGHHVLARDGFETVYSFGHRGPDEKATFLQLLPSKLELSPEHLVFVQGQGTIPAQMVKVGDVMAPGDVVTAIRRVARTGVHAPFTPSGTIYVNGVLASNYIAMQGDTSVLKVGSFATPFSFHWLSHSMQFPHRVWCYWLGNLETSGGRYSSWVAGLYGYGIWFLNQSAVVMAVLMAPVLVLAAVFCVLESALLLSPLTSALALLPIFVLWLRSRNQTATKAVD